MFFFIFELFFYIFFFTKIMFSLYSGSKLVTPGVTSFTRVFLLGGNRWWYISITLCKIAWISCYCSLIFMEIKFKGTIFWHNYYFFNFFSLRSTHSWCKRPVKGIALRFHRPSFIGLHCSDICQRTLAN